MGVTSALTSELWAGTQPGQSSLWTCLQTVSSHCWAWTGRMLLLHYPMACGPIF